MKRALSTLLLAAGLGVSGCAALQPAAEVATLRAAPRFTPAAERSSLSISIAPVRAAGVAAGARYAYVRAAEPNRVFQAETLFWDEPPPRIVEHALVEGLRARFAAAGAADSLGPADLRLLVRLVRFEELSAPTGAQASIALDVSLLRVRDQGVVFTGGYCALRTLDDATPSGRAQAFELALRDLTERLAIDIARGRLGAPGC